MLPAGAVLPDAVGLRLNARSFERIGPVVTTLTTVDTAAIAPPGTVFLDECITQVIVCTVHAKASTAAAPTIGDFSVALDSNQRNVRAVVTRTDLQVPVDVDARLLGIPSSCDLEIDADLGDHRRQPRPRARPDRPHLPRRDLVGASPTVTLGTVNDDFVGASARSP